MVKRTTLRYCLRFPALIGIFATTAVCAQQSEHVKNYKGTPYQDGRYQSGAQKIPGRVECAYYDRGGEGVAISYTKFHDQIDNSPYDLVQPPENQLYVGWTEPGEWFNVTVQVAHAAFTAPISCTPRIGAERSQWM